MISCFALWCILLYVWSKAVFAQLQFYILTIWLYSISTVAFSSGREIVQAKMLEKIKQDKLNAGEVGMENVDEIELPAEEKSIRWKRAVISYSLSTTLVLASPIMYLIFNESMYSGEVCKFYMLSG